MRKLAKLFPAAVIKDPDIQLIFRPVDTQLREMSRYYGYKEDEFKRMIEQNGSLEDLRGDMLMSKVLDKLAQYADK